MRPVLLALACLGPACLGPVTAPAAKERPQRAASPRPAPVTDPRAMCAAAILRAEREHGLSAGLLGAIAVVESGRPDPATGRVSPWPWTINAEGQGRFFETKAEAVAAASALLARGVSVVDVGCLQVNLHHHPTAFADLEEAFDPMANARYAGLFLKRLYAARQDWEQAAAAYHSQTPELGDPYRLRVLAAWPAAVERLAAERQRAALVAAWSAAQPASGPRTIQANGFRVQALALAQQPDLLGRTRGRGVLEPLPLPVLRSPAGRPVYIVELAEAPGRR
ncbi:MAG TPA: transglycosylase SLT domain-containing protein [Crenalkalicoccus sp.]|nr:transglycosylase SLT domain-containing protein [Crenalkalicoccus sp.]